MAYMGRKTKDQIKSQISMCGDKMRKWRISYRAIHNLYVPEYKDLLFWHEMDIREDVDQYLRDMGIKKTTI